MRLALAAALSVMLIAGPALADPAIPANDMINGAVDGYIRPGFAQFADDTATLEADVGALCAAPSAATLAAAQAQFRATAVSFARIEFLRLGPLGVGDRLERLLFWPDPKGIALRQVQGALAKTDATATSADTLRKKSVAMQGLGALEYLLFGTGSDGLGDGTATYRCSYAAAITELVAGTASTVKDEWDDRSADGPVAHMLDPQPDAQDYRTTGEVLNKLAGTLINGTETIRDQRLLPIIGAAEGRPRPKSALFWRSGMTVPMLKADFDGMADFFRAAKFGPALGSSSAWITNSVLFEFEKASAAADSIDHPIDKAVGDADEFAALKSMVTVTSSLDSLLGTNLAQTLGLSIGFSLLDGD